MITPLILVDIPSIEERSGKDWYVTIPLGIITTEEAIITGMSGRDPDSGGIYGRKRKDFHTYMKTRFILQILYKNASLFFAVSAYYRQEERSGRAEASPGPENQELMELLELEKSLLYFSTSLRSNEVVFEKLLRNGKIKNIRRIQELLEDVIIENKQAIEMASIYSGVS